MAVERVLSNLNLISFKTECGLQNHIDELQDGDLVFTPDNSLKGNLFDFKWTDHKLNDISWLNADTFSWQSGDVYVAAFEHLVNDYISLSGKGVLYAWTNTAGDETYYTKTSTPSVGDQLFDETGTPATVSNAYVNGEISVVFIYADGSITYARTDPNAMLGRDASKDVTLSAPQSETETISGITIRYYKADDGHKICMQDQEANVQALYEATGIAWYYIIDMINKRFKLPRTKFGFTGLRDSVGGYVKAGLPDHTHTRGTMNITGKIGAGGSAASKNVQEGAFYYIDQLKSKTRGAAEDNEYYNANVGFDASRTWSGSTSGASNSIYGNSDTVQPKATQMYLYFYVGNFEREAVEQTAGITSEQLNNKADTDLSNLTSVGKNKLGPKIYRVTGQLINSTADTVEGYGVAEVYLYPNGIALIEFSIQYTKSGTSTSYFDWGINRDLIHSLNPEIPIITPKGGNETYYTTSGNVAADRTGYGGTLTAVSQFWQPGRVYNLDGHVGGWPAGNFVVNQRVVGTAWGTYEI